jgi:hypothetical protein
MSYRTALVLVLLSTFSAPAVLAQAPVAQGWAGWARCKLTIQGPGYNHGETHLWTITGAGTSNANMEIYPTSWTVTGSGDLDRVSGPTRKQAQWRINGMLPDVTIAFTRHADRIAIQRWTNHGPARSALIGTETTTINGVPTSRRLELDVQQWAFPATSTRSPTSTRAAGSKTERFDGLRGPLAPPGSMGMAECQWDFAKSPDEPSPPPRGRSKF